MTTAFLIDERSTPPLRALIGRFMSQATRVECAIANVRLAAIDMRAAELARLRSCRLLLDRLDVEMLDDAAHAAQIGGILRDNLAVLRRFVGSGRVEIRAAGAQKWSPDFSIVHGCSDETEIPGGAACLVGAHYFSRPVAGSGASLTCCLIEPAAVARASTRFGELWAPAHDVLPVVIGLLDELVG